MAITPFLLISGITAFSSLFNKISWKVNVLGTLILGTAQYFVDDVIYDKILEKSNSAPFGKKDWERHFGKVGNLPSLPGDIEDILDQPCPFSPDEKVRDTHILTLIPKTVGKKPLTLESLREMAENPLMGHSANLSLPTTHTDIHKNGIKDSYWILMTKMFILSSEIKGGDRSNLNLEILKGTNYDLPECLEAATSILTHHVRRGDRLYEAHFDERVMGEYASRTCCKEEIQGSVRNYTIGEFRQGTRNPCLNISNGVSQEEDFREVDIGVAAVRRLVPLQI